MIDEFSNRSISYVSLDFEGQLRYLDKLTVAGEAFLSHAKFPLFGVGVGQVILRDAKHRCFCAISSNKLYFESLGMSAWYKSGYDLMRGFGAAIEGLGASQVKRMGLQIKSFVPLNMKFAEMVNLMFGAYLPPRLELESVVGDMEDALVQIHGQIRSSKVRALIMPQSLEQAMENIQMNPNLDLYLDRRHLDPGIKQFCEQIKGDCLTLDIDISQSSVNAGACGAFLRGAFDTHEQVFAAAIKRLTGI